MAVFGLLQVSVAEHLWHRSPLSPWQSVKKSPASQTKPILSWAHSPSSSSRHPTDKWSQDKGAKLKQKLKAGAKCLILVLCLRLMMTTLYIRRYDAVFACLSTCLHLCVCHSPHLPACERCQLILFSSTFYCHAVLPCCKDVNCCHACEDHLCLICKCHHNHLVCLCRLMQPSCRG